MLKKTAVSPARPRRPNAPFRGQGRSIEHWLCPVTHHVSHVTSSRSDARTTPGSRHVLACRGWAGETSSFCNILKLRQSDSANHREVLLFAPPLLAPSCSVHSRRPANLSSVQDRRFATPPPHNLHGQTKSRRRPWRPSTRARMHPPHQAGNGGSPSLRTP